MSEEIVVRTGEAKGLSAVVRRLLLTLRLHELARTLLTVAERLDPSRAAGLRHAAPVPPVGLICVYRSRNAPVVARLLATLPAGSPVALWALDEPAPGLATSTIGSGPGQRLELLQRCADALDLPGNSWLALCDDDVEFTGGSLVDAVRLAAAAGLDLAQPAHSWVSHWNWPYTRRRLAMVARRGGFVESGPVVLLSPRGRELALPLPTEIGMGWGIEARWAALRPQGLRIGVVDAVRLVHLTPVGGTYTLAEASAQEQAAQRATGFTDWAQLQQDDARWRPWQAPAA